jgi:hypothetical protein
MQRLITDINMLIDKNHLNLLFEPDIKFDALLFARNTIKIAAIKFASIQTKPTFLLAAFEIIIAISSEMERNTISIGNSQTDLIAAGKSTT